jgi:hypothetical protein
MPGDSLREILALVRAELDLDEGESRRLETAIRGRFGGERVYISGHPKRSALQRLQELPDEMDADEKARALGISVRRLYQLMSLSGRRC